MSTIETMTALLREKFKLTGEIGPDSNVNELGIDSLDVINFLYSLEEETGVKIPDEDIAAEGLETLADFARYIDARR